MTKPAKPFLNCRFDRGYSTNILVATTDGKLVSLRKTVETDPTSSKARRVDCTVATENRSSFCPPVPQRPHGPKI